MIFEAKETITLAGREFVLVAIQREGESAIYKCGEEFARAGVRERILKDLELHKRMAAFGFPVAELRGEGEHENGYYFIESSLGERHFGDLFAEDMRVEGRILDETFARFVAISQRFAEAQLRSIDREKNFDQFADGIHLDILTEELPEDAESIRRYFERVKERVGVFPFVITHGDFNSRNLYPAGVIDLEDSFMGPAGYDLATNIFHTRYMPDSPEYEYFRRYSFTEEQEREYLGAMDVLYARHGLPKLSDYFDDFGFCRAVWMLVRMHQWPKLQKFRYDLFRKDYL